MMPPGAGSASLFRFRSPGVSRADPPLRGVFAESDDFPHGGSEVARAQMLKSAGQAEALAEKNLKCPLDLVAVLGREPRPAQADYIDARDLAAADHQHEGRNVLIRARQPLMRTN